ncbi:MAG: copper transporter [Halanaerobiaceae bacterium]
MIIDLKHHIFTVTAIFAALGLGILIGTSLVGRESLLNEQEKIVEKIARDVEQVRKKNATLRADLEEMEAALTRREEQEERLLALIRENDLLENEYLVYTSSARGYAGAGNPEIISRRKKVEDFSDKGELIFWNLEDGEEPPEGKGSYCGGDDTLLGLIIHILEREYND